MELTMFELAFLGGWYALSYAVLKHIEIRIINTRLKEENKRLREGRNTGKGVYYEGKTYK